MVNIMVNIMLVIRENPRHLRHPRAKKASQREAKQNEATQSNAVAIWYI
jgi:hypothetical protein